MGTRGGREQQTVIVGVHVDKTRRDNPPVRAHPFAGGRGRQVADGKDFSLGHAEVGPHPGRTRAVNKLAAFNDAIEHARSIHLDAGALDDLRPHPRLPQGAVKQAVG